MSERGGVRVRASAVTDGHGCRRTVACPSASRRGSEPSTPRVRARATRVSASVGTCGVTRGFGSENKRAEPGSRAVADGMCTGDCRALAGGMGTCHVAPRAVG